MSLDILLRRSSSNRQIDRQILPIIQRCRDGIVQSVERPASLVSYCECLQVRSQFRVQPMPAHRYVVLNIFAANRSSDVAPECWGMYDMMTLPSMNKAAYSGFETKRRHHQKLTTRVAVAAKRLVSFIFLKK